MYRVEVYHPVNNFLLEECLDDTASKLGGSLEGGMYGDTQESSLEEVRDVSIYGFGNRFNAIHFVLMMNTRVGLKAVYLQRGVNDDKECD